VKNSTYLFLFLTASGLLVLTALEPRLCDWAFTFSGLREGVSAATTAVHAAEQVPPPVMIPPVSSPEPDGFAFSSPKPETVNRPQMFPAQNFPPQRFVPQPFVSQEVPSLFVPAQSTAIQPVPQQNSPSPSFPATPNTEGTLFSDASFVYPNTQNSQFPENDYSESPMRQAYLSTEMLPQENAIQAVAYEQPFVTATPAVMSDAPSFSGTTPFLPPGEIPVYQPDFSQTPPTPSMPSTAPFPNGPPAIMPPSTPQPMQSVPGQSTPVQPPLQMPPPFTPPIQPQFSQPIPSANIPPMTMMPPVDAIQPAGRLSGTSHVVPPVRNEPPLIASVQSATSTVDSIQRFQVEPKIAELEFLSGAEVLARVGTEMILLCDLTPEINKRCEEIAKENNVPPEQQKQLYQEVTQALFPRFLEEKIRYTVFYLDFKTTFPKERFDLFVGEAAGQFDREEIPRLLEHYHAANRVELDKKLQTYGSSLERERREFCRIFLGHSWMGQSANLRETALITQQDMIDYYEENKSKLFRHEARARWEELAVMFSNVPDEEQAWNMIADMGNRVMRGEKFAEVAKRFSQGVTAASGGVWDWCNPGTLRSPMVDHAIFNLPVGKLSTIFQDDMGYHIVRVIEREGVRYTPFDKVHNEIRKGIQEKRLEANRQKFEAEVYKKYPISVVSSKVDLEKFNDPVIKNAITLR
jgi:hypothetical protein